MEQDDAMDITYDIYILQLASELPTQLRETLIAKGFPTYVVPDVESALRGMQGVTRPILLACCGDNIDHAFECSKKLITSKDVHRFPLILLGKDVDSYENILNKHFVLATTLNTPCPNSDVLEAIAYTVKAYPLAKGAIEGTSTEDVVPVKPTLSQALRISEEPPVHRHEAYSKFAGVPELFFDQLQTLKLGKDGLGGTLYPRSISEVFVTAGNYLPTTRAFESSIRTVVMDIGKWGRLHLYRVAYITNQIADALDMPEEIKEHMRAALFLYPHSFAGDNPDLVRREYHEPRLSAFRRELCSRIKDSAMHAAINLKAPDVGNLLAMLGKLIGREEEINDNIVCVAASTIMAADLCDRVCFQGGHWNPRRAYMLMKKIRSEQLADIHPRPLCALVKFLSEAITCHPFAFIVPRQMRRDPKLQKAAEEWRTQRISQEEKRVPIASLMPGMKLSRPVITYDGREILSGDLTLDQDLIWRLWQLSTVRPLNGPLVIFSEN
ncbi:MAG: hypothetical protein K1X79_00765 [Oligoflexia bacterium]|nr:hypothetical protein [Oligoflexia bacterium]